MTTKNVPYIIAYIFLLVQLSAALVARPPSFSRARIASALSPVLQIPLPGIGVGTSLSFSPDKQQFDAGCRSSALRMSENPISDGDQSTSTMPQQQAGLKGYYRRPSKVAKKTA